MHRSLRAWFSALLATSAVAAFAGCGGGGGGGNSGRPDVLIVHASDPAFIADVVAKLSAFGVFGTVDSLDAELSTPTLGVLQTYDAVLVMSDSDFFDSVALGNVVADYVDSGGGVVLSEFTLSDAGADTLEGRFSSDDYYVIPRVAGNSGGGPLGMAVLDGSHPILNGVSTFSGGTSSYRPEGAVVPGAYDLVAVWNDVPGTPLIATRSIGGVRRADLGFYPPTTDTARTDFVDASTDAMRVVANALRWVAGDL